MRISKILAGFGLALMLAACGGGGGNPGTPLGGGANGTTPVSSDPVLVGKLLDASGADTSSISASGYTTLSVTLKDPSGLGIANQVVSASGDSAQISFPEGGSGLTNANGVASIKVARASLISSGAGSITVTFSYKVGSFTNYPDGTPPPTVDKVVTIYVGYQLSAANITLTNLDVGAPTLAAYGTRQVSVQTNINGVAATSTPVQVNFSATCGQISPSTASTNSAGLVVVSYTATDAATTTPSTLGCSGKTVEISASTIGAAAVSRSISVLGAPASNLSFVSANPSAIFLANSGGASQAIVTFKLVNARGEALLGQDVLLTLKTQTSGAVKASFGSVGNTLPLTTTTDATGSVSVPVFSGTVPTSVIVNAALVANPAIQVDSAVLTIASGRAVQSRMSLSTEKFALEGLNIDGTVGNLRVILADRQGNPVPDGTAVNFVTESGLVNPAVCYTGGVQDPATGVFSEPGNSSCSVSIWTIEPRPFNGRATVLAYVSGEEDFVDLNFNNIYDAGDTFTDLGNAFRDDNENLIFDAGEFSVPRTGSVGSGNGCPGYLGRPGSCDGVWGAADVRRQIVVIFASSTAIITPSSLVADTVYPDSSPATKTLDHVTVTVADVNGNSMPTGSTVTISAVDDGKSVPGIAGANCFLRSTGSTTVPNTLTPLVLDVSLGKCTAGDQFSVKVTTPLKTVTERLFTIQ